MIQLWILDGFLDHNLSLQLLQQVADVYKKIRVVPKGYNQALLWKSKKQPEYYRLQRPDFESRKEDAVESPAEE